MWRRGCHSTSSAWPGPAGAKPIRPLSTSIQVDNTLSLASASAISSAMASTYCPTTRASRSCAAAPSSLASPASCCTRRRRRKASRLQCAAVMEPRAPMLGDAMRPDAEGRFGAFGGKYVPETLMPALAELDKAYQQVVKDPAFQVRVHKHRVQSIVLLVLLSHADCRTDAHLNLPRRSTFQFCPPRSAMGDARGALGCRRSWQIP